MAGSMRSNPMLEVDGRDGSLEHGCEDVPAARDPLQLVLRCLTRVVEEPLAEPELLRHGRAALTRDDVGADLRETPFRRCAEAIEDRPCDRELEDAVAEELETLVRRRPIVRPRGVREDLLQFVGGELRRSGGRARAARPVASDSALMRDDVVDRLADGRELAGVLVGDLQPELVLEVHHDLHQIE